MRRCFPRRSPTTPIPIHPFPYSPPSTSHRRIIASSSSSRCSITFSAPVTPWLSANHGHFSVLRKASSILIAGVSHAVKDVSDDGTTITLQPPLRRPLPVGARVQVPLSPFGTKGPKEPAVASKRRCDAPLCGPARWFPFTSQDGAVPVQVEPHPQLFLVVVRLNDGSFFVCEPLEDDTPEAAEEVVPVEATEATEAR